MLLIARVVILLNEAKVLLPLPLQGQLPPLSVCGEIALETTLPVRGWIFTSPEQWLGNHQEQKEDCGEDKVGSFWLRPCGACSLLVSGPWVGR